MKEYEAVLRAAAISMVRVGEETSLSGKEKVVGRKLAEEMILNGVVRETGAKQNNVYITSVGMEVLEETYLEKMKEDLKNPEDPDVKAEVMVLRLKKMGIGTARYDPMRQRIGVSLEEWEELAVHMAAKR